MATLTPAKLNEIIQEYVTETVREEERDRATRNFKYSNVGKKLNSDSYDQMLLNIEEHIALLKERLAYGEHTDEMKSAADRAVDGHNLTPLDEDDYNLLCFKLHQAAIKAQEVVLKHWQPEGTYNQPADIHRALIELGIKPPTLPIRHQQGQPAYHSVPMTTAPPKETSIPLARVVDNFWDDRSSGWKPRTKTGYLQCKSHLLETLGPDTPSTQSTTR